MFWLKAEGRSENEILKVLQDKSRDNSRSPVQWDDSMYAGFTTNEPWIKVADNYQQINVEKALKDVYHFDFKHKTLKEHPQCIIDIKSEINDNTIQSLHSLKYLVEKFNEDIQKRLSKM